MSEKSSLNRLEDFTSLTPEEVEAVQGLGGPVIRLDRLREIRREGEVASGFYMLEKGWAMASHILPSGSRQILKVHLPGDLLGTPSMCSDTAVETLSSITPVVIRHVPLAQFGALIDAHPRLGALFLLSVQAERLALMDQLAQMGRTSAEAQLAAFLLDIAKRLTRLGEVHNDSFQLRLTQEHIGDLLGLTNVHVNRMMRLLEDKLLIQRDRERITILDRAALTKLAGRPPREKRKDLGWLPKSR